MSVTFEDARSLVEKKVQKTWSPEDGTLTTADYGWESSEFWRIVWGAREWLQDRDFYFSIVDSPALLVSKADGSVTAFSWDDPCLHDGFSPVGILPTN